MPGIAKLQPHSELPQLLDDVEVRVYAAGRFRIQLEIPKTSTLSEQDIEKILKISSWEINPDKVADGYEGGRSVLLLRESPIVKGRIELPSLQVSGIGFREIDFSGKLPTTNEGFCPPSSENFMSRVPKTVMGTSYAKGTELKAHRPAYLPMGTYTSSGLLKKVENTQKVAELGLENMVVPHVEAYGRYLDAELQNEEGPFGFIVLPSPDPKKPRAANDFFGPFCKAVGKGNRVGTDAAMAFYYGLSPYIAVMANGLRELHDKGRLVHLQTHLENFYVINGKPYVVDWTTMKRLGENVEENILNRVIDLKRPTDDFGDIFSKVFPNVPEEVKAGIVMLVEEASMEVYSGHPEKEIKLLSIVNRQRPDLRKRMTEFDAMVQWMKDEGIEGYCERKEDISMPPPDSGKKSKQWRAALLRKGSTK